MGRYIRLIAFVAIVWGIAIVSVAQDEVYVFESGLQFTIPAGMTVDDSSGIPVIIMGEQTVMDVIAPEFISEDPDATLDAPLANVIDFILGLVGFEGELTEEEISRFVLEDGREVAGFDFTNSSGAIQSIFAIRLTDGQVGILNFRTLEDISQETVDAIVFVASSLRLPEETSNINSMTDAELALTAGLSESLTYDDSGVSFMYPENFALVYDGTPPATIGINEQILITLVDPNLVGMPAGEPIEDVAIFAAEQSPVSAEDFEPFDIGGREALIATTQTDEVYATLVLIRFSDETVGIMDVLTITEPTKEEIDYLRQIAASFNSASTEASITSNDLDEANDLFEQAMAVRDAGEYDEAIDLFTQAIELSPNLGLAYYWRGATYQRTGDVEAAVSDYRQALDIAEDEIQIRIDIADVYALYGDVESAIAELESFIEDEGDDALPDGQVDALAVYRQIANGEYVRAFYFSRANRLREYGQFELALASNQVALDNEPEDALLHSQRGVIYIEAEDIDAAIAEFTIGIEIDPLPVLFYNRGIAYSLVTTDLDAIVDKVHDYQCLILLADDSITQEQIDFAQQGIDRTIISSDDYKPITDPADCGA